MSSCESRNSSYSGSNGWLIDFCIPWNNFPKDLVDACEKGIAPDPLMHNEMIRIVIDAIMKVVNFIPSKKEMDALAVKIVSKYPKSFQDHISGITLGNGYQSISSALYYRIHYIVQKKNAYAGKKLKQSRNIKEKESYGCAEEKWNPDLSDLEKMLIDKQWLQLEFGKVSKNLSKVKELMDVSYPLQRKTINEKTTVLDLQSEWPFLFQEEYLLCHYDKLSMCSFTDLLKSLQGRTSAVYK